MSCMDRCSKMIRLLSLLRSVPEMCAGREAVQVEIDTITFVTEVAACVVTGAKSRATQTKHEYFDAYDQCLCSAWSGMQRQWNVIRLLLPPRSVLVICAASYSDQGELDTITFYTKISPRGVRGAECRTTGTQNEYFRCCDQCLRSAWSDGQRKSCHHSWRPQPVLPSRFPSVMAESGLIAEGAGLTSLDDGPSARLKLPQCLRTDYPVASSSCILGCSGIPCMASCFKMTRLLSLLRSVPEMCVEWEAVQVEIDTITFVTEVIACVVTRAESRATATKPDYFDGCDQCLGSAWSGMQRQRNLIRLLLLPRSVLVMCAASYSDQVELDTITFDTEISARGVRGAERRRSGSQHEYSRCCGQCLQSAWSGWQRKSCHHGCRPPPVLLSRFPSVMAEAGLTAVGVGLTSADDGLSVRLTLPQCTMETIIFNATMIAWGRKLDRRYDISQQRSLQTRAKSKIYIVVYHVYPWTKACRIGEASHPGPGQFRQHRRGKRSVEASERRCTRYRAPVTQDGVHADASTYFENGVQDSSWVIWHANVQGLRSKTTQIEARIQLAERPPQVLCFNETFLDRSVGNVTITNFTLVARRDRSNNHGGGVCVYVADDVAANVTLMQVSETAERIWCMLHTDMGPYLVGVWYRPGDAGHAPIDSCEEEHHQLSQEAMGTLLVGDLNVHHVAWLGHSSGTSTCGQRMRLAAARMGLRQIVRDPTRNVVSEDGAIHQAHLLDLVLTDTEGTKVKVAPKISDHKIVEVTLNLPVPEKLATERHVWNFANADWERLQAMLQYADWSGLENCNPDVGAEALSSKVLEIAETCIKKKRIIERKSTHPWLNENVLLAVAAKRDAEDTQIEKQRAKECSQVVLREHSKWADRVKEELRDMARGSKSWWARERQLQQQKQKCCSIPALKSSDGIWVRDSQGKADLLAETLSGKYSLPAQCENEYTELKPRQLQWLQDRAEFLTPEAAQKIMSNLREDSATGPDAVPTRIIKRCSAVLAYPVYLLGMSILATGQWPCLYTRHWIACLFKKKSVYDASNYRGVHMTAQFAKILERFVGLAFLPTLACEISVGPNQFAYLKQRGARDALAYLVLSWLAAFREKASIALYMSDVSGAFDRVSSGRLLAKLRARGMPQDLLSIIASWLRKREAQVVVGGAQSTKISLENQVFQGTVWGPSLWNTFYADSSDAIRKCSFKEIIFADDLNAWRKYEAGTKHDEMKQAMEKCQEELHKWGDANQVKFDAGKEHQLILSRHNPHGDGFALLGVDFDTKLLMSSAVHDLARNSQWKVKAILRTGRFNTGADLVNLYKAQVLSFIEYRTAAIYHACSSSLEELQHVQGKILFAAGLSAVEALRHFRLAPLSVQRDIALARLDSSHCAWPWP